MKLQNSSTKVYSLGDNNGTCSRNGFPGDINVRDVLSRASLLHYFQVVVVLLRSKILMI